jgi:hypothetical protein
MAELNQEQVNLLITSMNSGKATLTMEPNGNVHAVIPRKTLDAEDNVVDAAPLDFTIGPGQITALRQSLMTSQTQLQAQFEKNKALLVSCDEIEAKIKALIIAGTPETIE